MPYSTPNQMNSVCVNKSMLIKDYAVLIRQYKYRTPAPVSSVKFNQLTKVTCKIKHSKHVWTVWPLGHSQTGS